MSAPIYLEEKGELHGAGSIMECWAGCVSRAQFEPSISLFSIALITVVRGSATLLGHVNNTMDSIKRSASLLPPLLCLLLAVASGKPRTVGLQVSLRAQLTNLSGCHRPHCRMRHRLGRSILCSACFTPKVMPSKL